MYTIIAFIVPIKNSNKYLLIFKKSKIQIIHYELFKEIKSKIIEISGINFEKHNQVPRCRFNFKSMTLYIPNNFEISQEGINYILNRFGLEKEIFNIKIKKTIAEKLDNKFNLNFTEFYKGKDEYGNN
jgi:hypothetical protein